MDNKMINENEGKLKRICCPTFPILGYDDRISSLPNEICGHIMSFLSHKDGVVTSVLSKRWRYIWAVYKNLDFSYSLFPSMDLKRATFMDFVERSLSLHAGSNIQKLRISFGPKYKHMDRVSSWVEFALKRKVQELELDLNRGLYLLPSSIFTTESLKVLKLKSNFVTPRFPSTMTFSRLIKLHVEKIEFMKSSNATPELFCSCPTLEDLNLDGCFMSGFETLDFSFQTLKSLTINDCSGLKKCTIKVSCPCLVRFKYLGLLAKDYSLVNLSCLVEAFVDIDKLYRAGDGPTIQASYDDDSDSDIFDSDDSAYDDGLYSDDGSQSDDGFELPIIEEVHRCDVSEILRGISSANAVEFSFIRMEFHMPERDVFESLPKFYHLKYLKIRIGLSKDHLNLLTCLLENSPNLETLIVDFHEAFNKKGEYSISNKLILEFPIEHLKMVEILYFRRTTKIIEFRHRAPSNSRCT